MTNTVRSFVNSILSEDDRIQIIKDGTEFENAGFIGTCVLRNSVGLFKTINNIPQDDHEVMWMNLMLTEVYRYYALKHLGMS